MTLMQRFPAFVPPIVDLPWSLGRAGHQAWRTGGGSNLRNDLIVKGGHQLRSRRNLAIGYHELLQGHPQNRLRPLPPRQPGSGAGPAPQGGREHEQPNLTLPSVSGF